MESLFWLSFLSYLTEFSLCSTRTFSAPFRSSSLFLASFYCSVLKDLCAPSWPFSFPSLERFLIIPNLSPLVNTFFLLFSAFFRGRKIRWEHLVELSSKKGREYNNSPFWINLLYSLRKNFSFLLLLPFPSSSSSLQKSR